jgi:hypothetical protein
MRSAVLIHGVTKLFLQHRPDFGSATGAGIAFQVFPLVQTRFAARTHPNATLLCGIRCPQRTEKTRASEGLVQHGTDKKSRVTMPLRSGTVT